MATIKFKCPSCGSDDGLLRSARKIKSYDDLIGTACANCGHKLTDEEIKRQALDIAEKHLADMLKRGRG